MVYLNDILIYTSKTKKEYKKKIQEVLQLLKKQNIQLNKEKSKFTKTEVIFLKMIISRERLKIE